MNTYAFPNIVKGLVYDMQTKINNTILLFSEKEVHETDKDHEISMVMLARDVVLELKKTAVSIESQIEKFKDAVWS